VGGRKPIAGNVVEQARQAFRTGNWKRLLVLMGRASSAPPDVQQTLAGLALEAANFWRRRQSDENIRYFDFAVDLYRATGPLESLATALDERGCAHRAGARYDLGERDSSEAVELHRKTWNTDGLVRALGDLSGIYLERGAVVEAQALCREAIALDRARLEYDANNAAIQRSLAVNLYNLARALFEQGSYDDAEQLAREAEPLTQELNGGLTGNLLNLLANIALSDGRLDDANALYARTEQIYRSIRFRQGEGIALSNRAISAWDSGRMPAADLLFDRAIKLHQEVKDERSLGITLTARGDMRIDQVKFAAAAQDLDEALGIAVRLGQRWREAFVRAALGSLAHARDNFSDARICYHEAAAALEAEDDRASASRLLCETAGLEADLGRLDNAELMLSRAHGLDPKQKTGSRTLAAVRNLAEGRLDAARARTAGERKANELRARAEQRIRRVEAGELHRSSATVRRMIARLQRALSG
jgi:tetratricopeptide (TPR) repeat protein